MDAIDPATERRPWYESWDECGHPAWCVLDIERVRAEARQQGRDERDAEIAANREAFLARQAVR